MMGPVLAQADAFVTTSTSARETIHRAFPALAEKPFEVIRHGRDFAHLDRPPPPPPGRAETLRLLVLGNISRAKGAELLRDLAALDTAERLEIHVAGEIDSRLKPARIFLHGPYERDSAIRLIEEVKPHLGAVLSLWPETYSHTLTELWSAGVPVLGFDLGAVGERIRETGGGWLLQETTPEAVHQALRRIAADTEGHAARTAAVEAWRQGEGRRHGTGAMATAYAALYARLGVAARR
jgi:glycosyltransferase involved in cell wall biosynthesis